MQSPETTERMQKKVAILGEIYCFRNYSLRCRWTPLLYLEGRLPLASYPKLF